MARKAYGKNADYRNFCEENGFLTGNGQVRLTAEVLTKYFTNDLDFVEEHQGLADVLIEKDILLKCLAEGIEICPLWN
jgi:hypothetical protein